MSTLPRILFVVPPIRLHMEEWEYLIHLPRHAVVLAAELQAEYDVRILDVTAEFHGRRRPAAANWQSGSAGDDDCGDLAEYLRTLVLGAVADFAPDIIAIHAHAAPHIPIVKLTFDAVIEVLRSAPNILVAIGGMAATHLAQAVADWAPDGSWIIRGEGTGRVRDILALLRGLRQPNPATERVSTLRGRRAAAWIVCGGEQDGAAHLERPPETTARILDVLGNPPVMDYGLPRFDLLPMDTYVQLFRGGEFVPHLEMSSGCTYACKFCGVHYLGAKGRFRRRPTANVIGEMRFLRDHYGFDEFYFCDETFTLDKKHARELCERMIAELPGIRWRCVTRVDEIDRQLAELMRRAGCFEIGFGVEVGSDDVLLDNTKEATVASNVATIAMVQAAGIDANALTIIGMPQEDHRDIRRTFEFLARDARPNRCQIFVFHPVPGTEYFDFPEAFGLRFDTRDVNEWYKWDHIGEPVSETACLSREDIARYFMLFNRAFSTIMWPERDDELIARILENRFPVRRRGVAWQLEGDRLRIYHADDPSRNMANNSLEFLPAAAADESPAARVRVAEYILSRCCGLLTCQELCEEVARLFELGVADAERVTRETLEGLRRANLITEF